ncbi:hypothetical protein CLOM_g236 [Closterium sp. NIES-68]|nr:hypothetical protein CLOM_g236 [Closterium sp. NIES-68]GJP86350.1 hypothetical protein CLOP_g16382 [Closterium sp. NIES-67]
MFFSGGEGIIDGNATATAAATTAAATAAATAAVHVSKLSVAAQWIFFATRASLIAAAIAAALLFSSGSPAIAADVPADVAVDVAVAPRPLFSPEIVIPAGDTAAPTEAPTVADGAPKVVDGAPKVVDGARLLTESQRAAMQRQLAGLEATDEWRIRVATRYGAESGLDGKQIRDLWQPSDRTVIIVADVSSPNILNFSIGEAVRAKLPYQFFMELQSRYGNQFFVRQEGESEALTRSVDAIRTCLAKPDGCLKVPGLVDDLYFLTLGVSVAAGAVFGFSARLPPQGQVEASWQWVAIFSPLWLLLLLAFGVFPVIDRTADLEPLIKNLLGFGAGAGAVYMTPILGESPVAKLGKSPKEDGEV